MDCIPAIYFVVVLMASQISAEGRQACTDRSSVTLDWLNHAHGEPNSAPS